MSSPGTTYLPNSSAINGLRSRERAHKSWTFLLAECIIQLKFPPQPNLRALTSNALWFAPAAAAVRDNVPVLAASFSTWPGTSAVRKPETGDLHLLTKARTVDFCRFRGIVHFRIQSWDNGGGGNIFRWKSSEGNFQAAVHWWQRWKWQPGSDKFKVFLSIPWAVGVLAQDAHCLLAPGNLCAHRFSGSCVACRLQISVKLQYRIKAKLLGAFLTFIVCYSLTGRSFYLIFGCITKRKKQLLSISSFIKHRWHQYLKLLIDYFRILACVRNNFPSDWILLLRIIVKKAVSQLFYSSFAQLILRVNLFFV